jgi:hypothetical protein
MFSSRPIGDIVPELAMSLADVEWSALIDAMGQLKEDQDAANSVAD